MTTWREDVETALRSIGGQGTLSQIYDAVRARVSRPLPATWQAIVRRELEYNSSDSESYQHRYDLFFSVRGIGAGVWGSENLRPSLQSQKTSNHHRNEFYRRYIASFAIHRWPDG